MTVALAAMSGWPNDVIIIGAEDQMVTAGDINFEQPQPKMFQLNDSCAALIFGLSAAQAEVVELTRAYIREKEVTNISAIADVYARQVRAYMRREAEAEVLAPLGLSRNNLFQTPPTIDQQLARHLVTQLQKYPHDVGLADEVGGALIVGADATGGHLYRIDGGRIEFLDNIGFAAAGGGHWHAESLFMFSGYTHKWSFADALSLVYAAKKRAEAVPGVGRNTDIVIVFTRPPRVVFAPANSPLVSSLERIYQDHKAKQDDDLAAQHRAVKIMVGEFLARPAPPEPAAEIALAPAVASAPPPRQGEKPALTRRARKKRD